VKLVVTHFVLTDILFLGVILDLNKCLFLWQMHFSGGVILD